MKIQDVLNKNVMLFDLQATDKEGVIMRWFNRSLTMVW